VPAIGIIWYVVNWGYSKQTLGLKAEIAALEQRLKFYIDRSEKFQSELDKANSGSVVRRKRAANR